MPGRTAASAAAPSPLRGRRAATSALQDGAWLLEALAPGSTAHRVTRAYEIAGAFRPDLMLTAWQAAVDRHELLRTNLVEFAGHPIQQTAAVSPASFRLVDLSRPVPGDRAAAADRAAAEAVTAPIDLAAGPLARLTLLRLDPVRHRLVLVLHRAVADERSASVLLRELSAGYGRLVAGQTVDPTPLPVPYAELARWQRERADGAEYLDLLRWWTSALTPLPAPLALPSAPGHRRPGRGGTLRFDWSPAVADRLAALCRAEDVPPAAVLLTAFGAVLARLGGTDRLVVGVPAEVRPPRYAGTVGPFENLLPIVADLSGTPTFRALLGRSAGMLRAAVQHRAVPFGHLLRSLAVERNPDRLPLCDAVLVVRPRPAEEPAEELVLTAARVRRTEPADPEVAALTLTVQQLKPTVAGTLAWPARSLGGAWARVLLDQVGTLLAAALAAPDSPVATLPMDAAPAPAPEAAAADPGGDVPVPELVARWAAATPDAVAVDWGTGTLTYAELDREAALLAGRLRSLGVGAAAGSPVAVRMAPGHRQAAASLGVLRAGGSIVWFGRGDAGERGRAVLAELRPVCLLVDGDAGDPFATWYAETVGGAVVDVTDPGTVVLPAEPVSPDAIAYQAYTSGSTGRPKGIAHNHAALAQLARWTGAALGLGPGARVAQWVAPEHDPALYETFGTLVSGGTLCPVPERIRVHPEKTADWLAAERVTFLQTVPSFMRELLAAVADRRPADRPRPRGVALMGEALPAELAEAVHAALPGVRLTNVYGPTETVAATWCDVAATDGPVPIGRAIPGREVLVLDGDDRPCPTGVTGEIVVRSRYVAAGYVGDPTAGADDPAFRPVRGLTALPGVRCYRTGDLARRRPDGQLEFRGRRDLQVKLSGARVELAEVESALAAHPSVAACAVVPLADADGLVSHLVAYVVPRPAGDPANAAGDPGNAAVAGPSAWRRHLRSRFGASMLLTFEILPGGLPRNVAGKIDRRRLPPPARPRSGARPRTAVEQGVLRAWAEVLGVPAVDGVSADGTFFAAGGHSLLVPRLVNRLRERFGVEVPLRDCFAHSTVAGMSALVADAGRRDVPAS